MSSKRGSWQGTARGWWAARAACAAAALAGTLWCHAATAQTPFVYRWGPRDGLVQYSVSVVTQDEHGYIWLGTESGASRFSGRTFVSFTASNGFTSGPVLGILPVPGAVWLVSEAGALYRVAGSDVTEVTVSRPVVAALPRPGATSPWLVAADGLLDLGGAWRPFPAGLAAARGQRVHHAVVGGALYLALATTVVRVREHALEVLWRGDRDVLGLLPGPEGQLEVVLGDRLASLDPVSGAVATVTTAPAGAQLTCGAAGGGRRVLGTSTGALVVLREATPPEVIARGLPGNAVRTVLVDREDNVWAGVDSGGVLLLPTTVLESYTTSDGLLSADAFYLVRDTVRGGVWAGMRNGGVAHLRRGQVRPLGVAQGLPSREVRALHQTATGELLIGTVAGAVVLDRLDRLRPLAAPCGRHIRFFFETGEGVVWAGTQEGFLLRLAGGEVRCVDTAALPRPVTLNGMVSHGGELLLATSRGLFRLAPDGSFEGPFCDGEDVRGFAVAGDGALWVTSRAAGAFRLHDGAWSHFGLAEGFDSLVRYAAVSPEGQVWFASDRGVWSFPDVRGSRLSAANGLSSGNVFLLRFDPLGQLWVGTDRGLNVIRGGVVEARFDYRDGLADNEVNGNVLATDEEGRLWFATMGGVSSLDPRTVGRRGQPPLLDLAHAEIDEAVVDLPHDADVLAPLLVPPGRRSVRFVFSGQSFANPTQVVYTYTLEGLDSRWSRPSATEFAHYTALPPGHYTFRARAVAADGLASATVSLPVEVQPAFWERPVARALLIGLAVVGVVLIHSLRTRRMRRRNLELEKVVVDRTREVAERRDQLELINELVKAINSRHAFGELLSYLLRHTGIVSGVQNAVALVWDRDTARFRPRAVLGWSLEELADVRLTAEEARARYTTDAEEVFEDVYLTTRSRRHAADEGRPHPSGWQARLVMCIRVEDRVEGYLVFESPVDEHAFSSRDLLVLGSLKEHIVSAFAKTRMLQELQALDEKKNEFLGMAAHDLRSPLHLIHGWASLLLGQLNAGRLDPERGRRDLSRMVTVAEQMSRLIGELLDIAAIESGRLRLECHPLDLWSAVVECEQLHVRLATDKGIALAAEGEGRLPPVMADRDRVLEVLTNLVSNAIKFTHPGGRVQVTCEALAGEVVTHVTDTGVGLTEEDLKAVFVRFGKLSARPTAAEPSTGLGLAIVRKIVEAHGGRVFVASRRGVGSTFSFSLPRAT